MARWYVQHPGAVAFGPIDAAELRAAWQRQQVPPGALVCAEGFSQWVPFHSVAELVGAPPPGARGSPRFWSPLWAVVVAILMQYAGCQMLSGAVPELVNAGGLEHASDGQRIMFLLMSAACFGVPFAFWLFAHYKWGRR